MSAFSNAELAYLQGERRLARLATVGPDGTPHITRVGMWTIDPDTGVGEEYSQGSSTTMRNAVTAL